MKEKLKELIEILNDPEKKEVAPGTSGRGDEEEEVKGASGRSGGSGERVVV